MARRRRYSRDPLGLRRALSGLLLPGLVAAMALLAAAGGVLANVRQPLAGAGWCEPPHLWVGNVGLPSSGKTPALEAVLELVRGAEATLA